MGGMGMMALRNDGWQGHDGPYMPMMGRLTINGTSMTGDGQPNMPPLLTLHRAPNLRYWLCKATRPRGGTRCICTVTAFV